MRGLHTKDSAAGLEAWASEAHRRFGRQQVLAQCVDAFLNGHDLGAERITNMSKQVETGTIHRIWLTVGLIGIFVIMTACMPITMPTPVPLEEPEAVATEPSPEETAVSPEAATATPQAEAAATEPPPAEAEASEPTTVDLDAIFPPDKETERNLVMFNCGSCHAWVCAVIDQRPVEHWRTTKANHRDLVSSLTDEEYDALFNFLSESYNDTQPEPPLPAALRDLGCTTQ